MIRDHLATSFTIERGDLEMAPFDAHGGLGTDVRFVRRRDGMTSWLR